MSSCIDPETGKPGCNACALCRGRGLAIMKPKRTREDIKRFQAERKRQRAIKKGIGDE